MRTSLCVLLLQPVSNADFIVPVEIDGTIHQVGHSRWLQEGCLLGNRNKMAPLGMINNLFIVPVAQQA